MLNSLSTRRGSLQNSPSALTFTGAINKVDSTMTMPIMIVRLAPLKITLPYVFACLFEIPRTANIDWKTTVIMIMANIGFSADY